MPSLPFFHDFGRPRMVDGARLEPFSEAFRAYVLWRSIPRRVEPAIVIAQRDADGGWRWCGGFAGLPAVLSGRIQIRPLSRRVSAEHIRAAMWAEAVSGLTVRNRDAGIWKAQIERGLPDDLLKTFFGPRGVTPSSAAAHFGTTRQTLALHLRDTHG